MPTPEARVDPASEEEFLAQLYRGGELLAAGNVTAAKDHLERAYSLHPKNEKAQNLLGLTYFKLGIYDRAAHLYERLVLDNPVDPTLRVNLGLVYLKSNDLPRCIREFETATDLAPEHKKAHNYLGLALAQAGEYARAREHFVLAGSDAMADKMSRAVAANAPPPKKVEVPVVEIAPPPPPPEPVDDGQIEVMSAEERPPTDDVEPPARQERTQHMFVVPPELQRDDEPPPPPPQERTQHMFVVPPELQRDDAPKAAPVIDAAPVEPPPETRVATPIDPEAAIPTPPPAVRPSPPPESAPQPPIAVAPAAPAEDEMRFAEDEGPPAPPMPEQLPVEQPRVLGEAPQVVDVVDEMPVVEATADVQVEVFSQAELPTPRWEAPPPAPVEDAPPAAQAEAALEPGETAGVYRVPEPAPEQTADFVVPPDAQSVDLAADQLAGAAQGEQPAAEFVAAPPEDAAAELMGAVPQQPAGDFMEAAPEQAAAEFMGAAPEQAAGEFMGVPPEQGDAQFAPEAPDFSQPALSGDADQAAADFLGASGAEAAPAEYTQAPTDSAPADMAAALAGAQAHGEAPPADEGEPPPPPQLVESMPAWLEDAPPPPQETWQDPGASAEGQPPAPEQAYAGWTHPVVEAATPVETPAVSPDGSWETPPAGSPELESAELPRMSDSQPTAQIQAVPEPPHVDIIPEAPASGTHPGLPAVEARHRVPLDAPPVDPSYAGVGVATLAEIGPSLDWSRNQTAGPFLVNRDGLALQVRGELLSRLTGLVAVVGTIDAAPEMRKMRGRATDQPFGEGPVQMQRVTGHGMLYLEPGRARFHAINLDDDAFYVREELVFAFEEAVAFENGRLVDGNLTANLLHLKGEGQVLLRLEGELKTMAIPPGSPLVVPLARLVGWYGMVNPRLKGFVGQGAVELNGEGYALLVAPS
jgi:uncharacterized protein (AIM24 family)